MNMHYHFIKSESFEYETPKDAHDLSVIKLLVRNMGYSLDSVDGKPVVGLCEVCEKPILEDEYYANDVSGCVFCADCIPDE